ncbi:prepilin peptidase [Arthrobacter caoxuetaonis]|uniref:A24 family peptidase n=1 Tax=Arthrobacter caoxuetaonis TaxID=2886935 RepID=A0A9X1SDY8_9MICC|nr:A24 family peptidase [Arthrobacter caoxuetaonis]MCC3299247.1 A24 family peptidase [Arthrobacter caoxuetaonis]USQ59259.1 A24 family peptidase [Arthrobacter caoxuetaonis]
MSAPEPETLEDTDPEGAEIVPFTDEPWVPRIMNPEVGLPAAAVAAGVGALAFWLRAPDGPILAAAAGLLCAVLVILAVIDMMTRRLPDAIVLPAYPLLGLAAAAAALAGEVTWAQAGIAAACMAGCYAVYWLICFFTGGMGWGDVKLAGVLGLALGLAGPWDAVYGVLVLPMILGGVIGFPMLFRGGGKVEMPFGPFMVAAAVPVLMMPDGMVPWLMDLFR